jgi:excalibur calcium-binding domain-containing protein
MVATKRMVCVLAALTLASACGTTPTPPSVPVIPTPTTSSSSTVTSTSTETPTTSTAPPLTVPIDLAGKSAATVEAQLKSLGFTAIRYVDSSSNMVTMNPSWIVESVNSAGNAVDRDAPVIVHVVQPPAAPAPAPKTATPKPAPPKTTQPAPPKVTPPKPAPAPYYANCTAAKAAGAAPLYRGQPGYRPALDRDNDGIACEV